MKSFPPLGRIKGRGENFGPIVMSVGYILISPEPEFDPSFRIPSYRHTKCNKEKPALLCF